MVQPKFCQHQDYAKGDSRKAALCDAEDPQAQLFCMAHLCESSAYQCPYCPSEIYNQNGIFRIAHKGPEGNLVGRCEDFELIPSQDTSPPQITQNYQEPSKTHYSGSSKNRRPKSQTSSSKSPKLAFVIQSFRLPCPAPKACKRR